jgi:elongator complex protein 1
LYKEALEIYKYQPEQLREITQIYADYLQNDSRHKDAAIGKLEHFSPMADEKVG